MRGIREYADVLYPEVTIINDDLDTWKQDCSAVLEEAKWNNPNKKIFACIMTNYFNKTGTIPEDYEAFADAYKPIKEATWLNALEYLYTEDVMVLSLSVIAKKMTLLNIVKT